MTTSEIYKKTLGFSLRRLLYDVLAILLMAVLSIGGFFLAEKIADAGLIGLGIGLVIGIVVLIVTLRYVSYTFKAGQIAMMTKGITEGQLPDDVIGEGKKIVKERFITVAVFYAATGVIKGIFNQIGRGLIAIGNAVGGEKGGNVASAINSIIQVIISYLSDCCLGWVFYRKEENAARATCEGAVLFFKHGKVLAKNLGRVFGIGLASLAVIGGAFTGVFYLIFSRFPLFFTELAKEFAETNADSTAAFLSDPNNFMLVCAAIAGIIIWSILHSTFVRPYVLSGVLHDYILSGADEVFTEESFAALDSKSSKFKKLHSELT